LEDQAQNSPPVLPPARPPEGLDFWIQTWSGRLLIANAVVFVCMSLVTLRPLFESGFSGSVDWLSVIFLLPAGDVLHQFGAKDPVGLAAGEWWRFFAPMFVHIGLIHFLFNTWALKVIGWQIERILGGPWFLATWVAAGVAGNIASAVTSVAVSAGASGALFGLLGAGWLLERAVGEHIRRLTGHFPGRRIYTSMIVINLVFGFVIPGIDNAAHVGGLVAGAIVTAAMLRLRNNRLHDRSPKTGFAMLFVMASILGCGALWSSDSKRIVSRLVQRSEAATSFMEAEHFLSEAIRIEPESQDLRLSRARLWLMVKRYDQARLDLEMLMVRPDGRELVQGLASELRRDGFDSGSQWLIEWLETATKDLKDL
jgi:rhomboid protease GluP